MARRADWPKIRTRQINGKTYFVVDLGRVDGRRVTTTYASKKEAELYAERARARKAKIGNDAVRLGEGELRDAARALELLGGRYTLAEAVEFFLLHRPGEEGQITVGELYQAYLNDRELAGRTLKTLADIRQRLGRFAEEFDSVMVHEITTGDLERWLHQQKGEAVSKRNYHVHLTGLFNFALKRKYIAISPASGLTRPKIRRDARPGILKMHEVRALMHSALEHDESMIPYFAVCLFAGVRPVEAQRLDWKSIDFDRRQIFIGSKFSKTGSERYIRMEPNLIEWLLPHRQRSGNLHFSRKVFERVRKLAGVEWSHDCMRHSYGSYHLAAFRNAGDTAELMGHQGAPMMLFKHYRSAVTEEAALAFWDIRPQPHGGETISFDKKEPADAAG